MNNQYFPHLAGGDYNLKSTFPATFNFNPDLAISLDPRQIISEWSEDALNTLNNKELFAGQQIYCLGDKVYRICRWVPTVSGTGKFSANNCIWDVLHAENEDEDEWFDVKNDDWYQKSIDERILDEEDKIWSYEMKSSTTAAYVGFYNFPTSSDIKEFLDESLQNRHKVFNMACNDPEVYKTTYIKALQTGTKTIKLSTSDPDHTAVDKNIVIIIPSSNNKEITNITIGGLTVNVIPYTNTTMDVVNSEDGKYNMIPVNFNMYIADTKIYTGATLPDVTITFGKIS